MCAGVVVGCVGGGALIIGIAAYYLYVVKPGIEASSKDVQDNSIITSTSPVAPSRAFMTPPVASLGYTVSTHFEPALMLCYRHLRLHCFVNLNLQCVVEGHLLPRVSFSTLMTLLSGASLALHPFRRTSRMHRCPGSMCDFTNQNNPFLGNSKYSSCSNLTSHAGIHRVQDSVT